MRVRKSAELSSCGHYRWWLRRVWDIGNGEVVCFLMLNPSTADASQDDPTIRRCLSFAQAWGFSALSVRNLFPYRATDPRALLTAPDPLGGGRGDVELLAGCTAHTTVAAWGASVPFNRDKTALALIARTFPDKVLYCLGLTKRGHPRHPLYVARTEPLIPYPIDAHLCVRSPSPRTPSPALQARLSLRGGGWRRHSHAYP